MTGGVTGRVGSPLGKKRLAENVMLALCQEPTTSVFAVSLRQTRKAVIVGIHHKKPSSELLL